MRELRVVEREDVPFVELFSVEIVKLAGLAVDFNMEREVVIVLWVLDGGRSTRA